MKKKTGRTEMHFFGVAAQAMRHILVDYAPSKNSQRRGGFQQKITLVENVIVWNGRSDEIATLDDALLKLTELDERKSKIVEMKFFGGLTFEEIAEVLQLSIITIKRDWSFAKNWLSKEIARK